VSAAIGEQSRRVGAGRWIARNGWTLGVWVLLAGLIVWYSTLIPVFGDFQISSIVKNSMPSVYSAAAQAVIVIAGGIDLGVGAMMVLANAVSARFMEDQEFGVTLVMAVGIVGGAALLNALVGWVIVASRVPDIVVTLATLFVFSGVALMVLPSPGGGTSDGFRQLFTGSEAGIGSNYWPSVVAIALPAVILATWLKRTRRGVSLYAIGSDSNAAYLSGVNTARAKVVSYAIGGSLAALAGLATTAITNTGTARFTIASDGTLNSVAAVVLGGIALTGGVGSVIGAAGAGIVLFILNPILTAMAINPNTAQVIRGALIVAVMMVAGILEMRRWRSE
jgi:ribose transport system permease protein